MQHEDDAQLNQVLDDLGGPFLNPIEPFIEIQGFPCPAQAAAQAFQQTRLRAARCAVFGRLFGGSLQLRAGCFDDLGTLHVAGFQEQVIKRFVGDHRRGDCETNEYNNDQCAQQRLLEAGPAFDGLRCAGGCAPPARQPPSKATSKRTPHH